MICGNRTRVRVCAQHLIFLSIARDASNDLHDATPRLRRLRYARRIYSLARDAHILTQLNIQKGRRTCVRRPDLSSAYE
ncbi:MAG: hypothetical protein CTY31_01880 [Hyphomicrobium sp.]|nr:MAG: hypothetical protein CTY39_00385 [Hyphomicrobium sp.]PPD01537.1 MAG: hypothetical protein CTY31_01880 [Hyphomicrobium sp.]